MKNNLKVSNMVMTGRLPFKRKYSIDEANYLIENFDWISINDEISPILSKRINLRKKQIKSVHNKIKQPYVSIWSSGAINIVGVISRQEANKVYEIVIKELKRILKCF